MEVCFVGPLGVVTGSCTWLRDIEKNWNFLIDCGMQQGETTADKWNSGEWPFDPAEIKFVVLTHAHIDHCGLIPLLYRKGFKGQIYCTKETEEIAKFLLKDAAGQPGAPFNRSDVDVIKWQEPGSEKQLGTFLPIDTNLFLQFYRTGHVMGAVSVVVRWGPPGDQKSMVFSGDLGPSGENEEGLPLLRFRMSPVACDYAVVESTYGGVVRDSVQSPNEIRRSELRQLLDKVIESKGTLILPSFSFGRTQDVLFDLHWIVAENPEKYRQATYMLDSPLACKLQKVMLKGFERQERTVSGKVRPRWLGKQVFDIFGLDGSDASQYKECLRLLTVTFASNTTSSFIPSTAGNIIAKNWRPILSPLPSRISELEGQAAGPRVVITSSGSCDGGPVASWLPKILGASQNIVAMTGHVADASVGGLLAKVMKMPPSERTRDTGNLVWANGINFPISRIKASITLLRGYSAHADQKGLLDWLFWEYKGQQHVAGRAIFIQHGGNTQREKLARAIHERAYLHETSIDIFQPSNPRDWWNLEDGASIMSTEAEAIKIDAEIARLTRAKQRLQLGGDCQLSWQGIARKVFGGIAQRTFK
ncbi:MBL fold metallo-hydrolase [Undibacterium seohonense]|uniref:MBL fold metallo-hydrolase n=1 Tax=Undibacterium seohonense TaxID=1344950 RepID=A0ABR6X2H1_9BURK|nr:MBL fold metallo-hydrolase [Undibacterium seohonense]MBC3807051.1 MBL fold metallo-hydrolase [Undibacterium seohonense]